MKRGVAVCVIVIGFLSVTSIGSAQDSSSVSTIKPFHLSVGRNATSNLIFPYSILSVDRGSAAVVAQKAKGAENILQLKAAVEKFPLTNLTVITTDARLYSFIVEFDSFPSVLNWRFNVDSAAGRADVNLRDGRLNEKEIGEAIDSVRRGVFFLRRGISEQKMKLQLRSLYIYKNECWISLVIRNTSYVAFEPENIRLFVQDKKKVKRTASQQSEIKPFRITLPFSFAGHTSDTLIIGIRPLTLPSTQTLIIQIPEKEGGRLLRLILNHRVMLKARQLCDSD